MSIRFKYNIQREDWPKIGYGISAVWMFGVLFYTEGETRHPFFQYIFIVPLAAWILALAIGAAFRRLRSDKD